MEPQNLLGICLAAAVMGISTLALFKILRDAGCPIWLSIFYSMTLSFVGVLLLGMAINGIITVLVPYWAESLMVLGSFLLPIVIYNIINRGE